MSPRDWKRATGSISFESRLVALTFAFVPRVVRPMIDDRTPKFLILGAGSSGLAAAKNLQACGIPFDCVEREDDVGGNWYYGKPHSSVYASTHLISSKRLTEYTDFPMPAEWPEYPSHRQAWEYLRAYARQFGLDRVIEFNTGVTRLEPDALGWLATLDDGRQRRYRGAIICNGHHWDPRWPEYPGQFQGRVLHSSQYKTPDVLDGRRVLVVGGGNSGCDIAVESAQHAERTFHSLRRGYHYLPKFIRGKPIDQAHERLLRWGVPLAMRRWISQTVAAWALGRPERFGLPRPDHRLFETHPIINSQMMYYAAHGRLSPKPDVAELLGDRVRFVDGSIEPIDVLIYATGFRISFPFLDPALLNVHGERPQLYLNIFHPQRDDLFVVGLIQPDSGQWGLVDRQSQLIARYLVGLAQGSSAARALQRRKGLEDVPLGGGIRYLTSPRHALEVEHFSYRRHLERLIRGLPAGGNQGVASSPPRGI